MNEGYLKACLRGYQAAVTPSSPHPGEVRIITESRPDGVEVVGDGGLSHRPHLNGWIIGEQGAQVCAKGFSAVNQSWGQPGRSAKVQLVTEGDVGKSFHNCYVPAPSPAVCSGGD